MMNTKEGYPGQYVARPLVLPPMMGQAALVLGVNNATATGEGMAAAFDMGVMAKIQAGAMIQFPLHNPDPDFGMFTANAQYNVMDFLNARLDLGAEKVTRTVAVAGMTATGSATGFVFGIGAPVKYKLNDMLAFTSGRPFAWTGVTSFSGTTPFGDDIIQMAFVSGTKLGLIHVPLGVVAQLHEMLSVGLRVGFAAGIADANGKWVPIGVDAIANVMKPLDIGFSFDLPGCVDSAACGSYGDIRQISIFGAYRL